MGKPNRGLVAAREARAWELSAAGLTLRQIAERLTAERLGPITFQGVEKILRRVAARHAAALGERFLEHMTRERALQYDRLTNAYRQAMRAWLRSQEPMERVRHRTRKDQRPVAGRGRRDRGSAEEAPAAMTLESTSTTRTVQTSAGDARHLNAAMDALAAIRKLFGLDAATASRA